METGEQYVGDGRIEPLDAVLDLFDGVEGFGIVLLSRRRFL